MTGQEIARALRAHRGKVQIRAMFGDDAAYIYAEKRDLIKHFTGEGDRDAGVAFWVLDGGDGIVDDMEAR